MAAAPAGAVLAFTKHGRGDVIQKIDMVGQDLDTAQGNCGASSGMVPTDVGQPMIRVSSITVGGQA